MKKKMGAMLLFGVLALCAALSWSFWQDPMTSSTRREWKNTAIQQIEARLADPAWLQQEIKRVDATARTSLEGGWFSDGLLLMRNGDWIICRSICHKQPPGIRDLFIGRGSDGKWYYSTFHFCIDKTVLNIEPQPQSLAAFVHGYWLEPFDGRSDECLKTTWTEGPYGQGRP